MNIKLNDVVKVNVFNKGYLFRGTVVGIVEDVLTVQVPTYYKKTVHIVEVNVKDVEKAK